MSAKLPVLSFLSLRARQVLLAGLVAAVMGMPSGRCRSGEDLGKGGEDPAGGQERPSFSSLRAIQYTYSPSGGDVVLEWAVQGGKFTWFLVSVDSNPPDLFTGGTKGVKIEGLPPGFHEFIVEGLSIGVRVLKTVEQYVLEESPVEPVVPLGSLFFGYDPETSLGFLQMAWQIPDRSLDDPYVEFEITLKTALGGRLFWRTAAPDKAVTFSGIPEGIHSVEIAGLTWSYASPVAEMACRAVGMPSPRDVRLTVYCHEGRALGAIHFEIPEGTRFDAVAVWSSGEEGREFQGYHHPDLPTIVIELPERSVEVELAGAMFDPGAEDPFAISNLPGRPGIHAVARDWVNCQGRVEFRRGDAGTDGQTDISDAIRIVTFLFLDDTPLSCTLAADVDDNDRLEITDAVYLLAWLYAGGDPIPEPGPLRCGEDPTAGKLSGCIDGTCGFDSF